MARRWLPKGLAFLLILGLGPAAPPVGAADWQAVADAIGRAGEVRDGVYRVGFPRTDLHVSVGGIPVRTGLALGGWAAFVVLPVMTLWWLGVTISFCVAVRRGRSRNRGSESGA